MQRRATLLKTGAAQKLRDAIEAKKAKRLVQLKKALAELAAVRQEEQEATEALIKAQMQLAEAQEKAAAYDKYKYDEALSAPKHHILPNLSKL